MSAKKGAEAPDLDNDDYVAQLLAKDARDSSLRYSTLGTGAFIPATRPPAGAPKPNTRFLRNILRETDSHNANLKRKEEEEARERMRALRHGRLSSASKPERGLYDVRAAKRRRVEAGAEQKDERGRESGRHRRREGDRRASSRDRERERERRRREKRYDGYSGEEPERHRSSRSRHHKEDDDRSHRHGHGRRHRDYSRPSEKHRSSDDERERRRHRRKRPRHSRSPSRDKSPSPERSSRRKKTLDDHDELRDKHHHRSRDRPTSTTAIDKKATSNGEAQLSHDPEPRNLEPLNPSDSDSDPLESLIGPLPPSADDTPPLRTRGRGAYNINKSNIDAHFASGYDPALDVHPDDDYRPSANKPTRRPVAGLATEDDDWDMALEALRDRALWRRKGADRLREAGFDEGVVEKWAGNGAFAGLDRGGLSASHRDGEGGMDVEDVKWAKKGEKREWDRGKVLTDDGHVDVRAEWLG
ncbi:hypothetical protein AJ79_04434 [Helicocarpus griseus UAMH5409]|uniref:Uncharacterized protein n=1 Tax=Helicocarpus griseus UAMH5409 TaxID=1447875 RepID=A0A2B7XT26_9EURO|nr:hypothetical protein AJ79_04434 [Helicocarpus griseus UAMH5409]